MTDGPLDEMRRRYTQAREALLAAYDLPDEILGPPCPRCAHPAGPDHLVLVETPLRIRRLPAGDTDDRTNVIRVVAETEARLVRCADLDRQEPL